jgi:uncharacterized membrane protein
MTASRVLAHLFTNVWSVRNAFPAHSLHAIEEAIRETEVTHHGQIRFAVEHSLDLLEMWHGLSARERAIEVFAELRVWDTEHNNGVLVYFLLAEREFEIVADRGIHRHVGPDGWEQICRRMEDMIRRGEFEAGTVWGIHAVGEHLRQHFPGSPTAANELPDRPVIL